MKVYKTAYNVLFKKNFFYLMDGACIIYTFLMNSFTFLKINKNAYYLLTAIFTVSTKNALITGS